MSQLSTSAILFGIILQSALNFDEKFSHSGRYSSWYRWNEIGSGDDGVALPVLSSSFGINPAVEQAEQAESLNKGSQWV